MKKKWQDIIIFIISIIFIAFILFIAYLEEKYNITHYLWIFNVVLLVTSPLYYYLNFFRDKIKAKKIENTILIKNIDFKYYRDIIEEYSPATLSLILDGLEFEKDLGVSIIYLINKGYLEVKEENKIIRTNKDCSKLSEDLQLLCNSDINHLLASKRLYTNNNTEELQADEAFETRKKWLELVEKQLVEKGLVTEREDWSWRTIPLLIIFGILEIIFAIAAENYILFTLSIFMIFVIIFLRIMAFNENKFVKTQKGYELYKKIVGLKNYIKDYSKISESELKEIAIWEEYLIYAIIFNNTSRINKEAMDYYKKICDIKEEEIIEANRKRRMKIYSILAIIMPIISFFIDAWPPIVGGAIAILGFYLTHKAKGYNKKITIAGYILNSILLMLTIFVICIT